MQNCYTLFISNTSFRVNILAGAPRVNHSHGSNSVLLPLSSILCRKSSCIIVLGRPQWSSFLNTTFLALLQSDDASFGLSLIHCSKLFQASAISPIHRCFVLQCCVRVLTNLQSILPTCKDRLRETRSCVFCISSGQHWVKTHTALISALLCCMVDMDI